MRAKYRMFLAFMAILTAFFTLGCGYVEHSGLMKADAPGFLPSKAKRAFEQVYEEYLLVMDQSPQMLISCPFCGGDGRLDTKCKGCNGRGNKALPGVTMFSANIPCGDCLGTGYAKCAACMNGRYLDPDYQVKHEEWDKQRRSLLNEMGYSDAEIDEMDRAAAQAYLDAHNQAGPGSNSIAVPGGSSQPKAPAMCKVCYGTGVCSTCYGDGRMENPYLGGKLQECTSCRNNKGKCWNCSGIGSK